MKKNRYTEEQVINAFYDRTVGKHKNAGSCECRTSEAICEIEIENSNIK